MDNMSKSDTLSEEELEELLVELPDIFHELEKKDEPPAKNMGD